MRTSAPILLALAMLLLVLPTPAFADPAPAGVKHVYTSYPRIEARVGAPNVPAPRCRLRRDAGHAGQLVLVIPRIEKLGHGRKP